MGPDAIHPELRAMARFLPRSVGRPGVVRASRLMSRLLDRLPPPRGGDVVDVGDVTVRVHMPAERGPGVRPALLWMHGGGYVIGHAAQDDSSCKFYADRLGAVVASVDYRLAPEHPFPAALYDCHDALVWLAARPDVDATRVAIGGPSAGGGLAAALAVLARDRGEVDPACQVLIYPMLDDRTTQRTDIDEQGSRIWSNEANRFGWRSYLGTEPGGDDVSDLASPARRDDVTGLAPAWVGVGSLDVFHDETVAYAERLQQAGVPCDLLVVDGAFHGFDVVARRAEVARRFRESQIATLGAVLQPSG